MESSEIPEDSEPGSWSNVPVEITARIMSLLPVPTVCTCRSVCKAWNELLRRPEFLDLCDRNGRKNDYSYLFVTAHLNNWVSSWVDGAYRQTTCFLDLDKRRWFLIGSLLSPTGTNVPRLLAMDDGLVCEFSVFNEECRLVMFDPVAMTTRALPAIDRPAFCFPCAAPPAIVTVVDNANFKVFLLSRSEGQHTGFFLYESSTDAWRDLRNPLEELGVAEVDGVRFAESAVYFQGTFYAAFYMNISVFLLSYNLEENLWKEVLKVESQNPGYPELVVFNNRMFMTMWLDDELHGSLSRTEIRRGNFSKRSIFEIREILENSSKSVVKIPYLELQRIFYGEEDEFGLQYDIACGCPINSNSVVLVSRHTGILIMYNVTSGCVGELPAHPLRQASLELAKEQMLSVTFRAKLMNLSLRNILTNSSSRVPAHGEHHQPFSKLPE